jgi:hypothetical protein
VTNFERITSMVAELVGLRCERVENPHGSILSVDFGELGHRADDPPGAKTHGWRHFTVLSPWRIESSHEVICDWNVEGGTRGRISALAQVLVGQRVVRATTEPPGWDLKVSLSEGVVLAVFGDATCDRADAWFILGTDGAECGATQVWCADDSEPAG